MVECWITLIVFWTMAAVVVALAAGAYKVALMVLGGLAVGLLVFGAELAAANLGLGQRGSHQPTSTISAARLTKKLRRRGADPVVEVCVDTESAG